MSTLDPSSCYLTVANRSRIDIIDIRNEKTVSNLKDDVASISEIKNGSRQLPTLLLYDKLGLQLFERITYLDEYYLTDCEIELLQKHSAQLASNIPAGSIVVELGSGNLRKVCHLLQAFEKSAKPIHYYALDLSSDELERTLANIPEFQYVSCHGLLGTYDDCHEWLKLPRVLEKPKCILHLGSSIGNFKRDEAAQFLRRFANLLQPDRDFFVVGLDSCNDPERIFKAYNDSKGVTHQFLLNGLAHANDIYGREVFRLREWRAVGEYVFDSQGGRHQAFVYPVCETNVLGSVIGANERVMIEQSFKYSHSEASELWRRGGFCEKHESFRGDNHALCVLHPAKLPFSTSPCIYAGSPLPTLHDWEAVWHAWDTVTSRMLPAADLNEKPINLRNACIFYLGHIPTFLDLQLAKATGNAPTEPEYFAAIFRRGIDPDVDNPEKCHEHSIIPHEWPSLHDIKAYQGRVRSRLRGMYKGGIEQLPRDIGRSIWMSYEHELMHLETMLYIMLQSPRTLPPPQVPRPDFATMALEDRRRRVPNQWFDVPAQTIVAGMDDPEDATDVNRHFGCWHPRDNEKPRRSIAVPAFQAKGRPITNEEYARYIIDTSDDRLPASWCKIEASEEVDELEKKVKKPSSNGNAGPTHDGSVSTDSDPPMEFLRDKAVRTVYGLVPLAQTLDWPVFASYDELAGCASWMGGRIPTFEEARSIYAYVEGQKEASIQSNLAKRVPAVNGHLVNDGVEETPPSERSRSKGSDNTNAKLFIDLVDANVGFQNWHPVAVSSRGGSLAGQSEMGGVWEWTSSPLRRHDGFEPSPLYPAYTADFFKGNKHNIVLGGSWATHPRLAGRKCFVNWFQRNYPYAWAGARLVRDAT